MSDFGDDGAAANDSDPESLAQGLVVPAVLEGERVDRAVALLAGWSRADAARVAASGEVLVDGRPVAKSHRLVEGTTLAVVGSPVVAQPPRPEPMHVEVRFEDSDLLVVSKPAGLVVHPGAGHEHGTLVHGLLARFPEIASVGDPMRPGIVHRLDRDTSGLMVVARSGEAYAALSEMLFRHDVSRQYTALVWGEPDAHRGVVDAPIGRSPHRPTRMAVPRVRQARTNSLRGFGGIRRPSDLFASLGAGDGSYPPIRVHSAAIGHTVVGDATYGGRRESIPLDRPFLHSRRLEFAHPITGNAVLVEEPLPVELERVIDDLKSG